MTERNTYLFNLSEDELKALTAACEFYVLHKEDSSDIQRAAREFKACRPRSDEDLIEVGMDRLRRDYYRDVRITADELLIEVTDSESGVDSARDELWDRLMETVDGSQWVIYTHRAIDVLRISGNDCYAIEEWGHDGIRDGVMDWSGLATGAMYADVQERLWDAFEEWQTTRDNFETELEEFGLGLADVTCWATSDRIRFRLDLPNGEERRYVATWDGAEVLADADTDGPGTEIQATSAAIGSGFRAAVLAKLGETRDFARMMAKSLQTELRERSGSYSRAAEDLEKWSELASDMGSDI